MGFPQHHQAEMLSLDASSQEFTNGLEHAAQTASVYFCLQFRDSEQINGSALCRMQLAGGYLCPRCKCLLAELPVDCPVCGAASLPLSLAPSVFPRSPEHRFGSIGYASRISNQFLPYLSTTLRRLQLLNVAAVLWRATPNKLGLPNVTSSALARSYHHLFPVPAFGQVGGQLERSVRATINHNDTLLCLCV
eukprot:SAG11_NODE_987_length_6278_cov_10.303447_4_plen_192_part_00